MNKKKWEKEQWLDEARSLLQWVDGIEIPHPITLLVRHSHRLHSENQTELLQMRLTPLGLEMARELGARIPKGRNIELFYSEHPRCKETALKIIEGYNQGSSRAINHGSVRELLGPLVETSIGPELIELGIDGFINKWADEEFPVEQIEPLDDYTMRIRNHVINNMTQTKHNAIFLNITHDLVLMSFRRSILGVGASQENWTPFLGGFGILKSGDSWLWYEKGRTHLLDTTSWSKLE